MKIEELIQKVEVELYENPLYLINGQFMDVQPYLFRYLLYIARIDFKGVRGISSRKSRVKKKIVTKQLQKLLIERRL